MVGARRCLVALAAVRAVWQPSGASSWVRPRPDHHLSPISSHRSALPRSVPWSRAERLAAADYFTKIAHEVTGSHRKEGHRAGGRTPMQLLADAVATYEESSLARWWEWEQASEGRRQLNGPPVAATCASWPTSAPRSPTKTSPPRNSTPKLPRVAGGHMGHRSLPVLGGRAPQRCGERRSRRCADMAGGSGPGLGRRARKTTPCPTCRVAARPVARVTKGRGGIPPGVPSVVPDTG